MPRLIVRSEKFCRKLGRIEKKQPKQGKLAHAALILIEENLHHPKLRTHKLNGVTQWASKVSSDCRIIFDYVAFNGGEAIVLRDIGPHDEVY